MTSLSTIAHRLYSGQAFKDFSNLNTKQKIHVVQRVALVALVTFSVFSLAGLSSSFVLGLAPLSGILSGLYTFSDLTQQDVVRDLRSLFGNFFHNFER